MSDRPPKTLSKLNYKYVLDGHVGAFKIINIDGVVVGMVGKKFMIRIGPMLPRADLLLQYLICTTFEG